MTLTNLTNLTNHAKQRMNQRVITLQDIYNTVKQGTISTTKEGHKRYTLNNIHVILDQSTNNVITVFYTSKFNKLIQKCKNYYNINDYAAIYYLRGYLSC